MCESYLAQLFYSSHLLCLFFFFSSRRRHTRSLCDWSSDVCSSDLQAATRKLVATLLASDDVTLVDSARVAKAVTAAEADGNPCDNACAVAVARKLGAQWVVTRSEERRVGEGWGARRVTGHGGKHAA